MENLILGCVVGAVFAFFVCFQVFFRKDPKADEMLARYRRGVQGALQTIAQIDPELPLRKRREIVQHHLDTARGDMRPCAFTMGWKDTCKAWLANHPET